VVVALVLLRLAIGWHFYRQGTEKLAYDPTTHEMRVAFSAEGFLKHAVGPLARAYHGMTPDFHSWPQLLATSAEAKPLSTADSERLAKWKAEYEGRRQEAAKKKEPVPVEFPPVGAYSAWAAQVSKDWQSLVDRFGKVRGVTEEQRKSAAAALDLRREQLAAYLEQEGPAIAEWQHELWRLHEWESLPDAASVPFEQKRISEKRAETASAGLAWVDQVRTIERGLVDDLKSSLTPEQQENGGVVAAIDKALTNPGEARLAKINLAVTCLVTGIGVCLLLGLFTRLASFAGILFLTSVILSQPPWTPGAELMVFYYQLVEIAALLVLAMSDAGRFAGLDFFIRAMFGKREE
jgi:uncharacterized membrane protein YphA (DoxX/SURF4 family)